MCGCRGGGNSRNIRPSRTVAPRIINQASINRKVNSVDVTPKTPDTDKKRVEKLRRDAIRKTFGK